MQEQNHNNRYCNVHCIHYSRKVQYSQNLQQRLQNTRNEEITQTDTCVVLSRVQRSAPPSLVQFQQVPAKLHVNCNSEVLCKVLRSCSTTKSRGTRCYCTVPNETTPKETPNKTFPGHSSRVPAVPKCHRRVFRFRNQLSRNGGALIFASFLSRISCRLRGRAYSAARLFS